MNNPLRLITLGLVSLLCVGMHTSAYGRDSPNKYVQDDIIADNGSTVQSDQQPYAGTSDAHPSTPADPVANKPQNVFADSTATAVVFSRRHYATPPENDATAFAIVHQSVHWLSTTKPKTPAQPFTAKAQGHYHGYLKADPGGPGITSEAIFDKNGQNDLIVDSIDGHPNPFTINDTFEAQVNDGAGATIFVGDVTISHTVSVRSHCKVNIIYMDDGYINVMSGQNFIGVDNFSLFYKKIDPKDEPGGD